MRVGVLTSGGDCPGLNAVLRAVARTAEVGFGDEAIGFHDAWKGVLEREFEPLTVQRCRGILPDGGTILGTSRVTPYQDEGGVEVVKSVMDDLGLSGFIVIGGEGSLACADRLTNDGIPCVGVPKTIDNDVGLTEYTFGFDTAVSTATEALDRLHTTTEAHERIMVLEVMGRHAGHIALHTGIAGGASAILIPEVPFDISDVEEAVMRRRRRGVHGTIVVVAEGAKPIEGTLEVKQAEIDEFGHERLGGIGVRVAKELQRRLDIEARTTVLGYIQRGGTPTAFDRLLSTRFGVEAMRAAHDRDWGKMVALQANKIVRVPIADAVAELKTADLDLYHQVAGLFVS